MATFRLFNRPIMVSFGQFCQKWFDKFHTSLRVRSFLRKFQESVHPLQIKGALLLSDNMPGAQILDESVHKNNKSPVLWRRLPKNDNLGVNEISTWNQT